MDDKYHFGDSLKSKLLLLFATLFMVLFIGGCRSIPSEALPDSEKKISVGELNKQADSLYKHGAGNPESFSKALLLYRQAAGSGLANAQFYYARMHQYGHGCEQDFDIAWDYYKKAAEAGDRRAWNNLGFMLKKGQGRQPDQEGSLQYFKRASSMGMAMASYNVAQHYRLHRTPKDFAKALEYYNLAVEQYPRYAKAYNHIGQILEEGGNGVEQDLSGSFNAYLLAANYGGKFGPFNLARFYREGRVIPRSLEMAEKLFLESASRGNAHAYNSAGNLYWLNKYKQKHPHKALAYYLKAYTAGEKKYLYRIGYIYKSGPADLRDENKAYAYLLEAAELKQPRGIRSLGYCYAYGLGTAINRERAEALWLDCGGDASLVQWHQLGLLMARENTDLPPDLQKAETYFIKGTETDYSGRAESWRRLGDLYRNSPAPMQDIEKAYDCYLQAAKFGDQPAQESIGELEELFPVLKTIQ